VNDAAPDRRDQPDRPDRQPGPLPTGRFAPSPTGPLHAGSLVAALASWLDARAQGGRWLVRIEDVDTPRCLPGMGEHILGQLAALGLVPDAVPLWQSSRAAAYQAALDRLLADGMAYPCGCSRREIDAAWAALGRPHGRFEERVYPGTCRSGLQGKPARATRLRTLRDGASVQIDWTDRRLGPQQQSLAQAVGDFILHRADGLWAYQLAVVVDDAAQGVSDVVRGADLADNTARQIHLQRLLGLPLPRYLHTPLVLAADGHKLSKQNGAAALDTRRPLAALQAAGAVLGLPPLPATQLADWLASATRAWAAAWPLQPAARGAMASCSPFFPVETEST
jgi:glutamyl-Q tRNA(Asp) synthetase